MRITRAVERESVEDLLQAPPRASLAYVVEGRVDAVPVAFRFQGGRHLIGVPREGPPLSEGHQVKLLIDDGYHYFELRGTWISGRLAARKRAPAATPPGLRWFELQPEKQVAWHYASMRERERGPG